VNRPQAGARDAMTLEEFVQLIPNFSGMSHVDRIRHMGWFLLSQEKRDRFAAADVTRCYDQLHLVKPGNVHSQLQQMTDKKPPELLKDSRGYRLEARTKEYLDGKYGQRPATIAIDAMLQGLPGRISDEAERTFLTEAIACLKVKAFRATIVMTWNLAFDHLLNWVAAKHLAAFNAAIQLRFPKRVGTVMAKKENFADEFGEFEVIEVCRKAGLFDDNVKRVLNDKLNHRNLAAHPSLLEFTQYQAEDTISDLVNNVILTLT
jgi:hypothetical protein